MCMHARAHTHTCKLVRTRTPAYVHAHARGSAVSTVLRCLRRARVSRVARVVPCAPHGRVRADRRSGSVACKRPTATPTPTHSCARNASMRALTHVCVGNPSARIGSVHHEGECRSIVRVPQCMRGRCGSAVRERAASGCAAGISHGGKRCCSS